MDREWVEYENDEGTTVLAHRVTPDTEGKVTLVGGGRHDARSGEVLVQSQNSNMFDVVPGRRFDEMFPARADGVEEEREFNPSDYTAKEVRRYLEAKSNEDDEDEVERVTDAERRGKNRKGALLPE